MKATAENTKVRPGWKRLIPMGAVAVGALALLWWVQTIPLPTVCPAIYPAPLYCTEDSRFQSAVMGTAIMLALLAAMFVVGLAERIPHRARILWWLGMVTVMAAVVFILRTFAASGLLL